MDEHNEVRLIGRVGAAAQERSLPSGDVVVTLRVIVRRPKPKPSAKTARGGGQGVSVDTIDIACWSAPSRRAALKLQAGECVEVSGSLRRRFFRAGGAPASRYEVEAQRLRKMAGENGGTITK